jgi:oxygen-independent coproporphyrinogen-3 oxidase
MEYVSALLREMELRRETLPAEVIASTLYFGGGTPSLLEPDLAARIIEAAKQLFALEPTAEITLEANPGTINREKLAAYRSIGVNRLSLGMQSFSDTMLRRLGRVHTVREGIDAYQTARDVGFTNIGIDLIHSLPGQKQEMWLSELDLAVAYRPEHISAYGLTIEAGTPFQIMERNGELTLPEEEETAVMFEQTSEVLRKAGYEHYEISNFALPGFRSRHNQVYWKRADYLGFGAGAHSFLSTPSFGCRWKNPEIPENYMQAVANGVASKEELSIITEREAMSERLFLGLRMLEGVDCDMFIKEFGVTIEETFPSELHKLLSDKLLERSHGHIRLSSKGLILANQVFMRFV